MKINLVFYLNHINFLSLKVFFKDLKNKKFTPKRPANPTIAKKISFVLRDDLAESALELIISNRSKVLNNFNCCFSIHYNYLLRF